MKIRLLNWHGLIAALVLIGAFAHGNSRASGLAAARESLAQTRRELQAEGFKTDLTNFDFSTSPELRAREAILTASVPDGTSPFRDHPDLMQTTPSNKAVIVWEQDSLQRQSPSWPDTRYKLTWDDFRQAINQCQPGMDAACAAILSGPIQFNLDAAAGNAMLLRHLALLKSLTQILNDRAMLALHDGNLATAWTNLMAATRLVTAWETEPAGISHEVRFQNTAQVFAATWQALQTNGWTDDQLARLQHEWEATDFLSGLPELQAFQRASDLKMLEQDESMSPKPEAGMYENERDLLLFYRDRETEFRNAVRAATWMQMRQMPGVTNDIFFVPKNHYRGRFGSILIQRRVRRRIEGAGTSFLGAAAEAEAERRIVITAVALERYFVKNGRYPETLDVLSPQFLKIVPVDFMTGQLLHYKLSDGGHFVLYSVGLDCADNCGKIQAPPATRAERLARSLHPNTAVPEFDLVWPLAASSVEVAAFRQQQTVAEAARQAQREAEEKAEALSNERQEEEARQAAMKKLLADKPSLGPEPVYQGKSLSVWVMKLGQTEFDSGPSEDAVAAIRAIGPKAVPFLLAWMPHPGAEQPVDGYPGWGDIEIAWWELGSEGKSAIPTLAHIIGLPRQTMGDYSVWTESAKAISHLGPDAMVPMLTVATNMTGQHELWELLHNFENLGTNGAPAVPALLHWANDSDSWVRDGVVSALGGIGQRPDLAVPVLTNALHDSDWMVRRDAAEALGAFARDSGAVLPALTEVLKSPPDWQARGGALSGLGKIHDQPDMVVPLIVPFLYDDNSVLARSAAYALRDLGSEAGFAALLQATNNPNIGDIIYQVREQIRGGDLK